MALYSVPISLLLSFYFIACTAQFFGGDPSVKGYAREIINTFNKRYNESIPAYSSTSSEEGVSAFINGTYQIAALEGPLSDQEDTDAGGERKLTIPLVLTTFSLMTKKTSGLKLTASRVARIYTGEIISWSKLGSKLSGAITPVARADKSESTKIISQWIVSNSVSWIRPSTATWYGNNSFFSSNIKYVNGSAEVGRYLSANSGSIGYIQTGPGLKLRLYECPLLNKANRFIMASESDPSQSVPKSVPIAYGSWAGFNLVNMPFSNTYPLVGAVYLIANAVGDKTYQKFLRYTQLSGVQAAAEKRYPKTFYKLPTELKRQNLAAIDDITIQVTPNTSEPFKAIAYLRGNSTVRGTITLVALEDGHTNITVNLTGLTPGLHGLHLHQFGDLSNGCNTTGGHYNPKNETHGAPGDLVRHAGDLGNVLADKNGTALAILIDDQVVLSGPTSAIGRAFVIHSGKDDLGRGLNETSLKNGNSGKRLACGVVGLAST